MLRSDYDFPWMIAPVTPEEFISDYWERQPLHIPRQDPAYYLGLGSKQELNQYLSPIDIATSFVYLVEEKQERVTKDHLSEIPYPDARGLKLLEELYEGYREGETIKWHRFDRRVRKLSDFCRNLGLFFSTDVGIDLYLTPQGSPSYEVHHDRYDFFILQIEGRKHWRVYDTPVALPRSGAKTEYDQEQGNLLLDVTLAPGDLLYMPRGYLHEGWTSDSSSLSFSVGMQVYTWSDLFMQAFERIEKQDVRFREALPIGFAQREEPTAATQEQFKILLERLMNETSSSLNTALNRLSERFYLHLHAPTDGFLLELEGASTLLLDSVVKKRADLSYRLIIEPDTVALVRPGRLIKLPKYTENALRFILEADEFSASSLPDTLSNDAKLVLVRRLMSEGFLTKVA